MDLEKASKPGPLETITHLAITRVYKIDNNNSPAY